MWTGSKMAGMRSRGTTRTTGAVRPSASRTLTPRDWTTGGGVGVAVGSGVIAGAEVGICGVVLFGTRCSADCSGAAQESTRAKRSGTVRQRFMSGWRYRKRGIQVIHSLPETCIRRALHVWMPRRHSRGGHTKETSPVGEHPRGSSVADYVRLLTGVGHHQRCRCLGTTDTSSLDPIEAKLCVRADFNLGLEGTAVIRHCAAD